MLTTRTAAKPQIKHVHDRGYKLLFSFPLMIEQLIKGFVPEKWVDELDFSTLKSLKTEHINKKLAARHNDLVWTMKFREQNIYFILLLEIQSNVDKFMAVRIMSYVALIYEDLIKYPQKIWSIDGKLPPVFPLVIHQGIKRWTAPLDLKHCLSNAIPSKLLPYQGNIKYMVLDICQMPLSRYTLPKDNLVSLLIAFEQVKSIQDLKKVFLQLQFSFRNEKLKEIKEAFLTYIKFVAKAKSKNFQDFFNFEETEAVLNRKIHHFFDGIREESIQECIKEGIKEGIKKGFKKGRQKGEQTGKQIGQQQTLLDLSLKLLSYKFPKAPRWAKDVLKQLNSEDLNEFYDNLLKAQSLDDLFE